MDVMIMSEVEPSVIFLTLCSIYLDLFAIYADLCTLSVCCYLLTRFGIFQRINGVPPRLFKQPILYTTYTKIAGLFQAACDEYAYDLPRFPRSLSS